jgi:hypothetical protein
MYTFTSCRGHQEIFQITMIFTERWGDVGCIHTQLFHVFLIWPQYQKNFWVLWRKFSTQISESGSGGADNFVSLYTLKSEDVINVEDILYQCWGYSQLHHSLTQIFDLKISMRILKSFMTVGPGGHQYMYWYYLKSENFPTNLSLSNPTIVFSPIQPCFCIFSEISAMKNVFESELEILNVWATNM